MLARSFNPDRPVVASSSFQAGEDVVAAGDAFDWRARGMTQLEALAMFSAGLLVHPPERALQMPGVSTKKLADRIDQREKSSRRKA